MADEQGDFLAMLRAPLVYRVPGMDEVTARREIAYQGSQDGVPRMDAYTPVNLGDGERRPAVLFVHGGPVSPEPPLMPTEWGVYQGYGRLAAASGWVGITFNHRFYGFDRLEQAGEDIAAAIAYVREHAGELHVDPDRLCLWAFSGGGPFLGAALREQPEYVRCLVAYYTVMDLRPLSAVEGVAGSVPEETLRRFSPLAVVEEVGAVSIPLLVARAGRDDPALNAGLDAFVRAALTANMTLDVLNAPAGYHAFDARNDDARTHEILAHTIAFVREHLTPYPAAALSSRCAQQPLRSAAAPLLMVATCGAATPCEGRERTRTRPTLACPLSRLGLPPTVGIPRMPALPGTLRGVSPRHRPPWGPYTKETKVHGG